MPEGTQAFIVLQNGVVVNKIVPIDPVAAYADLLSVYSDPSYTVLFFASPTDPLFLSTNAPKGGN
jgi:hypothetical protein